MGVDKKTNVKSGVSKGGSSAFPRIFISAASEDIAHANWLKDTLAIAYNGSAEVFLFKDVRGGKDWRSEIEKKAKKASVAILLCSPISIQKAWVVFEAGIFCGRNIAFVPLLFAGAAVDDLPECIKNIEAKLASDKTGLRKAFATINESIVNSEIPPIEEICEYFKNIAPQKNDRLGSDKQDSWKDRYKLCTTNGMGQVYALLESRAKGEPAHWLCATCYDKDLKSRLQIKSFNSGIIAKCNNRCEDIDVDEKIVYAEHIGSMTVSRFGAQAVDTRRSSNGVFYC